MSQSGINKVNEYLWQIRSTRFPGLQFCNNMRRPEATNELNSVQLPDGSIYWVQVIHRKIPVNPLDSAASIAHVLLVDEAKILDYAARYGSHDDVWFAMVDPWEYLIQPDNTCFATTTLALFRIASDGGLDALKELNDTEQFVLVRGDEIIHAPPEYKLHVSGSAGQIDTPESTDQPPPESERMTRFEKALEHLINMHSMENGSDTPDFLLAQYLRGCLENFNTVVKARSKWYGHGPSELGEALGLDQPLNNPGDPIGAEHENKL